MTAWDLNPFLRARPFRPFRVVMEGGEVFEVRYPDLAFLTQRSLTVGVGVDVDENDGIPNNARICSLSRIEAVEHLT